MTTHYSRRLASATEMLSTPIIYLVALVIGLVVNPASALTLKEAVNIQLRDRCSVLLGSSEGSTGVLTGELQTLCDSFPNGTSQTGGGDSTNPSIVPTEVARVLKKVKEAKENPKLASLVTTVPIGPRWTLFTTFDAEQFDRDLTSQEDGFDSSVFRLIGGTHYALNDKTDLGIALNLQHQDGDFLGGGNFKSSTGGLRFLASFYPTDKIYIQGLAGIDSVSTDRTRAFTFFVDPPGGGARVRRDGNPQADFSYTQREVSLQTGYNHAFGKFTITPLLGVTWLQSDYGTYTETNGNGLQLVFFNDERESLRTVVGVQGAMSLSRSFGVMMPHAELRLINEHKDEARNVSVAFAQDLRFQRFNYATEAGDSSFAELSLGVSFVYARGIQSFVRYQGLFAHDFYKRHVISLGLSMEL